jgi:hypothetical protein
VTPKWLHRVLAERVHACPEFALCDLCDAPVQGPLHWSSQLPEIVEAWVGRQRAAHDGVFLLDELAALLPLDAIGSATMHLYHYIKTALYTCDECGGRRCEDCCGTGLSDYPSGVVVALTEMRCTCGAEVSSPYGCDVCCRARTDEACEWIEQHNMESR